LDKQRPESFPGSLPKPNMTLSQLTTGRVLQFSDQRIADVRLH
jgi:hypothetical protein